MIKVFSNSKFFTYKYLYLYMYSVIVKYIDLVSNIGFVPHTNLEMFEYFTIHEPCTVHILVYNTLNFSVHIL